MRLAFRSQSNRNRRQTVLHRAPTCTETGRAGCALCPFALQAQKNLFMEEIWNLGLFLEISIIEKIRGIAEKIFSSQMQKYKVENIVERIIENKDIRKIKLDVDLYPFIEYMSYRLRVYGKKGNA